MLSSRMSASWTWCSHSTRYADAGGLADGAPSVMFAGIGADRYQVYAILDEVFLAGEIEETSKQVVLDRLDQLERLD